MEAVPSGKGGARPPAEEPEEAVLGPLGAEAAEPPASEEASEEAALGLSRIAWLLTTIALLVAMVVLGLRGDLGYAGVTLAVALAAAINLL